MIEQPYDLKCVTRDRREQNFIRSGRMAFGFPRQPEMEMVKPHDVEQKILVRPSFFRAAALGRGCVSFLDRSERQVWCKVFAILNRFDKGIKVWCQSYRPRIACKPFASADCSPRLSDMLQPPSDKGN
ncbi:MAG: hypothetical protein WBG88_13965 [Mesorhizobium sp.]